MPPARCAGVIAGQTAPTDRVTWRTARFGRFLRQLGRDCSRAATFSFARAWADMTEPSTVASRQRAKNGERKAQIRKFCDGTKTAQEIADILQCRPDYVREVANMGGLKLAPSQENRGVNSTWTEAKISELRQLHGLGLTGGTIAARMGMTRNQIIGKASRLKLRLGADNALASSRSAQATRLRHKNERAQKSIRPKIVARPPKPEIAFEPLPPAHVDDVVRKSFVQLEGGDCKFPIGDPRQSDFGCCGLEAVPGKPYCAGHLARCYVTPTVRGRVPANTNDASDPLSVRVKTPETV